MTKAAPRVIEPEEIEIVEAVKAAFLSPDGRLKYCRGDTQRLVEAARAYGYAHRPREILPFDLTPGVYWWLRAEITEAKTIGLWTGTGWQLCDSTSEISPAHLFDLKWQVVAQAEYPAGVY